MNRPLRYTTGERLFIIVAVIVIMTAGAVVGPVAAWVWRMMVG
jgi:hypothetical protein